MNAKPILLLALVFTLGTPCRAQDANATPPAPKSDEPKVTRTVIEDEGSRIEELRVRGQTQRITVTPKVGPRASYEILPAEGWRDMSDGVSTSRGAAGKRVWHVLSF